MSGSESPKILTRSWLRVSIARRKNWYSCSFSGTSSRSAAWSSRLALRRDLPALYSRAPRRGPNRLVGSDAIQAHHNRRRRVVEDELTVDHPDNFSCPASEPAEPAAKQGLTDGRLEHDLVPGSLHQQEPRVSWRRSDGRTPRSSATPSTASTRGLGRTFNLAETEESLRRQWRNPHPAKQPHDWRRRPGIPGAWRCWQEHRRHDRWLDHAMPSQAHRSPPPTARRRGPTPQAPPHRAPPPRIVADHPFDGELDAMEAHRRWALDSESRGTMARLGRSRASIRRTGRRSNRRFSSARERSVVRIDQGCRGCQMPALTSGCTTHPRLKTRSTTRGGTRPAGHGLHGLRPPHRQRTPTQLTP